MGTLLLSPAVAATPTRSKIVFPSQPPQVPMPFLASVGGGALPPTTYFVRLTWVIQTQEGATHESLPSDEVAIILGANQLLKVLSPPALAMPYALVGYNVYASTVPGAERLQNASPINIGANWQEPVGGLGAGLPPPHSWGATLVFTFPGREFPYSNREWKGHDEFSYAGLQQSITWYVDRILDFRLPYIQDGIDVAAWDQFLAVAVRRIPWDFYLDSTQAQYQTVIMMDANPKLAYYAPGLWTASITARRAILGAS